MEVIFRYSSQKWPITEEFSGDSFKISGKVVSHFEFRIRRTTELNKYLSHTTTQDVALTRRGIVLDVTSVTQHGKPVSVEHTISRLRDFVSRCTSNDNEAMNQFASPSPTSVVIWAPSTIIGQLQAKQDSVPTPLAKGTELTVVTDHETPYSDNIQVDRAIYDKFAYEKPNVDVREGMEDFARRYQAFEERKKNAQAQSQSQTKKDEDSDDDWD